MRSQPPKPVVTLYTTARPCPLCEDARALLDRLGARLAFDLRVVEIDGDPRLSIRHALRIPVVEVDGREASFGRVDPDRVASAIESALRPAGIADGTVAPRP